MPKLKRQTSHVEDSGFEIYSGPEPPAGVYRGVIAQCKIRDSKSSDNKYYNVLVRLEGNTGNKEQYNGYPCWVMLTMTDKEANLRREKQFYRAVCNNEDPEVVYKTEGEVANGFPVTKIGGKNPEGAKVSVQIRMEADRDGVGQRPKGDTIYPLKPVEGSAVSDEPDEDDEELEDEELEDEEDSDRRAELEAMKPSALRNLAKSDYDIDTAGMKKPALIEAILEHESEAKDAEDSEPDEDDEDEDDEDDKPDYAELAGLSLPKLRKKVLEVWGDDYDADDLKEMKKDEILEDLVENEFIEDDEPPF